MQELRVCFVGVGSIAGRHIRNLRTVCLSRGLSLRIDAFRRPGKSGGAEGVDQTFCSMEELPDGYDAVFITNPTELHLDALKRFHDKGRNFFIEKPVVPTGQIEAAKAFQTRAETLYYVACPLRYNAVIRYVKEHIRPDEVISVRSISSSYLPDWRPGRDYRETYSARRELGGGVSIDLIHEWDYLTWLFGWPEKVLSLRGKKSDLEIDSEDYAVYIAEYADKIAELHLDYFGRQTVREIQLFTGEDTIVGDIAGNRLRFLKSGKELVFQEERDDFQRRELEHFLDMIEGRAEKEDGFLHGVRVVELTQGRLER